MYTTSKGPLTRQECNIFGRIPSVCQKKGHKICKSSMHVAIFMKIWKYNGFESKYCTPLIVLTKVARTTVLIFVLALILTLATASATRNWDL